MEATRGNASSWLELRVQGPATVDFSWKSGNSNPGFSLLVDGKRAELMRTYEPSRPVRIEIPAGFHIVRWQAVAPKFADRRSESYIAYIGGIKVTPLASGEIALAALDLQIPWTVPFDWASSITLSRNGDTALQGPAATAASPTGYQQSRVKANFTGPGELSFWWRSEKLPADYGALDWSFQNSESGTTLLRRTPFEGWKQEKVWLPPGTSLFEWIGSNSLTGVDKVSVTAWPVYPLAAALDAPATVTWKTSDKIPFTGRTDLDAKGKTSAYVGLLPGESSWLEATVEEPGLFDFWLRK